MLTFDLILHTIFASTSIHHFKRWLTLGKPQSELANHILVSYKSFRPTSSREIVDIHEDTSYDSPLMGAIIPGDIVLHRVKYALGSLCTAFKSTS